MGFGSPGGIQGKHKEAKENQFWTKNLWQLKKHEKGIWTSNTSMKYRLD